MRLQLGGRARGGAFCRACALNQTIPDLSISGNRERWIRVEAAKKRAVYSLLAFGLPVGPKANAGDEIGVAFDFLADPLLGDAPTGEHVLTGHDNGLITLNVAEADSAEREKMRAEMGENYRTLLGHFRHELGHYYWDRLIRDDPGRLERFHQLFGDESADYDEALRRHYAEWRAAGLGDPPHLGLCGEPPLGRLGRNLRALSPHHRYAGDGARAEFAAWPA